MQNNGDSQYANIVYAAPPKTASAGRSTPMTPVFYDVINVKTAVYRLVNGGITRQKQQISEKGDDAAIHRLSVNVLPRNITFFRYLLFLMCNTAVN